MGRGSPGVVFALASSFALAVQSICLKVAFDAGVDPLVLVALRNTIAGVALAAAAPRLGVRRPSSRAAMYKLMILGATAFALASGSGLVALDLIPASTWTLVLYSYPSMIALFAVALGREFLDSKRVGVLACGFVGVALVAGRAELSGNTLGLLLALVAAAATATYATCLQVLGVSIHAINVTYLVLCGAALSLLPLAGAVHGFSQHLSSESWSWILITGLILVSALTFHAIAVAKIGATRTGIADGMQPILTVALAAIILDESLNGVQLAGAVLVVVSVVALPIFRPGENMRSGLRGQ